MRIHRRKRFVRRRLALYQGDLHGILEVDSGELPGAEEELDPPALETVQDAVVPVVT